MKSWNGGEHKWKSCILLVTISYDVFAIFHDFPLHKNCNRQ